MSSRVGELRAILDRVHELVRSDHPGKIIYDDAYQVGVLPRLRREPTPVPHGRAMGPTSPGSKREFLRRRG